MPKKLSKLGRNLVASSVMKKGKTANKSDSAAKRIRNRIRRGGSRFWKHADFAGLPPSAVATELSRLTREGELNRVGKGVYYHSTPTSFGPSLPSASNSTAETVKAALHPAGASAANVLGLTTQNPGLREYATTGAGAPKALRNALVHTGRPRARRELSPEDGALLEILRDRGRSSDLSPNQTTRRVLHLLADERRFTQVAHAAAEEPPRVRAMLGAIGQELNMPPRTLEQLRQSLNPLSRFDFGLLSALRHAKDWQAK